MLFDVKIIVLYHQVELFTRSSKSGQPEILSQVQMFAATHCWTQKAWVIQYFERKARLMEKSAASRYFNRRPPAAAADSDILRYLRQISQTCFFLKHILRFCPKIICILRRAGLGCLHFLCLLHIRPFCDNWAVSSHATSEPFYGQLNNATVPSVWWYAILMTWVRFWGISVHPDAPTVWLKVTGVLWVWLRQALPCSVVS